jgi:hypothetical protein
VEDTKLNKELRGLKSRAEASGRNLEQADVLEYARAHPKSAIYAAYEKRRLWDDTTAAEITRLEFAGYLIRRYVIVIQDRGQEKTIRGFVHIKPAPETSYATGYDATEDYLTNPTKRAQLICEVIKRALSALRWYPLPELQPIVNACNSVLSDYSDGDGPKPKRHRRPPKEGPRPST